MEHLSIDLLDRLYEGAYVVDPEMRVVHWNPAAEQLTGFTGAEVRGHRCRDNILRHVDEAGTPLCETGCPLGRTLLDGEFREATVYLHHKAGHRLPIRVRCLPLRDSQGRISGGLELFSGQSALEDLHERLAHLEQLALLDPLTGVANRRHMSDLLAQRLEEFRRYGTPLGVLFTDVDHFKTFNDTRGHDAGDRVLRMVAQTLTHNVRPFDTVGRWGGEEFLVLLANMDETRLAGSADRLRRLVASAFLEEGGEPLQVTLSIGAALAQPGDTPDSLVARADQAMYRSKAAGRNRVTLG